MALTTKELILVFVAASIIAGSLAVGLAAMNIKLEFQLFIYSWLNPLMGSTYNPTNLTHGEMTNQAITGIVFIVLGVAIFIYAERKGML